MTALAQVLAEVMPVEIEDDGALTLRRGATFASVRMVTIGDGLEMISLTQVIAWDLAADDDLRARVAEHAQATMLGTVWLVEHPSGMADVMLRYNFPAGDLADQALQTLVLMTLDAGVQIREALTA